MSNIVDATNSPPDWEDFWHGTDASDDMWYDLDDRIEQDLKRMKNVVKCYFTEDEWDAIYNALADYQDHGEEEAEMSYMVQSKITELFKD